MRKGLIDKINYSIALLKKAQSLALNMNENGFWLAFSGGKDSQVLYHLAKIADVKFTAHMNPTTIDPGEVIRFVKRNYKDVIIEKPNMSIYNMVIKKHFLPTRTKRFCCKEYKEVAGVGYVTLIGIRKYESVKRSKRSELETLNKTYSGSFDEFDINKESIVTCVGGKDKILLSPIFNWTDRDVWEFLKAKKIQHCKLYDEGKARIGCILCPMSRKSDKMDDLKKYPYVRDKYIEAIKKCRKEGYMSKYQRSAEDVFEWWISGISAKKYYAMKYLQYKINFKY